MLCYSGSDQTGIIHVTWELVTGTESWPGPNPTALKSAEKPSTRQQPLGPCPCAPTTHSISFLERNRGIFVSTFILQWLVRLFFVLLKTMGLLEFVLQGQQKLTV